MRHPLNQVVFRISEKSQESSSLMPLAVPTRKTGLFSRGKRFPKKHLLWKVSRATDSVRFQRSWVAEMVNAADSPTTRIDAGKNPG
jgi:hypothetical protein